MSTPSAALRRPSVEVALVVGPFLVLALLSAVQIYYRVAWNDGNPSWLRMIWTNLLAWAPWPLISPAIIRAWRRNPGLSNAVGHLARSLVVTVGFLVYLTFFRFAFFQNHTGPLSVASFPTVLAREAGAFFVPAWAIYWIVGAAGVVFFTLRERAPAGVRSPALDDHLVCDPSSRKACTTPDSEPT